MSEFNQKVREGRGGLQEVFFYCGWSAMEMARRRWALRGWLRCLRRPLWMQRLCSAPGQGRRHFLLVARAPVSGAPVGCSRVSRASVLSPGPRPGPPLRAGRKRGLDWLFQRGCLSLQSCPQKPQEEAAAFPLVWRGYW